MASSVEETLVCCLCNFQSASENDLESHIDNFHYDIFKSSFEQDDGGASQIQTGSSLLQPESSTYMDLDSSKIIPSNQVSTPSSVIETKTKGRKPGLVSTPKETKKATRIASGAEGKTPAKKGRKSKATILAEQSNASPSVGITPRFHAIESQSNVSLTNSSGNESSTLQTSTYDVSVSTVDTTSSSSSILEVDTSNLSDTSLVAVKPCDSQMVPSGSSLVNQPRASSSNDSSIDTSKEDGSPRNIKVPAKKGRKSNAAKLLEAANKVKKETEQLETSPNDEKRITQKRLSSHTEMPIIAETDVKRFREEPALETDMFNSIGQHNQIRNIDLEERLMEMTQNKNRFEKENWNLMNNCTRLQNLVKIKDDEINLYKDRHASLTILLNRKQVEISAMRLNEERTTLDNNKLHKEMKKIEELANERSKHFESVKSSLEEVMSRNLVLFEKAIGCRSATQTDKEICDVIGLVLRDYVETKFLELVKAKEPKKVVIDLEEKLAEKDIQIKELKIGHDNREAQNSKLQNLYNAHLKKERLYQIQIAELKKSFTTKDNLSKVTKMQVATINQLQKKEIQYTKEIAALRKGFNPKVKVELGVSLATKVKEEGGEETVESLKTKLAEQEAERIEQTNDFISTLNAFKSKVEQKMSLKDDTIAQITQKLASYQLKYLSTKQEINLKYPKISTSKQSERDKKQPIDKTMEAPKISEVTSPIKDCSDAPSKVDSAQADPLLMEPDAHISPVVTNVKSMPDNSELINNELITSQHLITTSETGLESSNCIESDNTEPQQKESLEDANDNFHETSDAINQVSRSEEIEMVTNKTNKTDTEDDVNITEVIEPILKQLVNKVKTQVALKSSLIGQIDAKHVPNKVVMPEEPVETNACSTKELEA